MSGRLGLVTSSEAQATRAGVAMLEQGGNAVDAAVATAFALAVTHPSAGNIGGGGFILVRAPGRDAITTAIDFRETAPAALTRAGFDKMQRGGAKGGAAAGVLCAAFVAWLWSRYGHRVNLALFFQVTAVFLAVFVVQLVIYGFHELTEANLFPYSEPLHWATEPYGPDGRYGQFLTYLLVLLPLGWLAFAALFGGRKPQVPARPAQQTAVR